MTEPRQIDPQKFLEANRDYITRVQKEGVRVIYDATLDTLLVEFGGSKKAISEHVIDNILLRIDPITLEIVGCEVLDFLKDFVPGNRMIAEIVKKSGLNRNEDSTHILMEPEAKAVTDLIMSAVPVLA